MASGRGAATHFQAAAAEEAFPVEIQIESERGSEPAGTGEQGGPLGAGPARAQGLEARHRLRRPHQHRARLAVLAGLPG